MFLTMLGDLAVFWLYVTLICFFFYITLGQPVRQTSALVREVGACLPAREDERESELTRGFVDARVQGLYRLYQLRKLTLSNNMIEWISPDISLLVHLQELNISRNGTFWQSYFTLRSINYYLLTVSKLAKPMKYFVFTCLVCYASISLAWPEALCFFTRVVN